jgi:hypothetical protein
MRSHPLNILALILLGSLCACQSVRPPGSAGIVNSGGRTFDLSIRNNSLALLADLLGDEKNLSKILIVKHNSDELGKLVKDISQAAGDGAKMLDELAKTDPGINLKSTGLPPGEAATRKAISKTKESLLLHSKDEEFEFQLLLTQSEGLNYGAHLAMVAAENEPQAERVRDFLRLAAQLRELDERVLAMLRKK